MRAYAELIRKWLDDETMEIEYLSDRDKWEPAPNPFSDLTVYFCKDKKEVFNRYRGDVVILCRIEASKIEVEE